MKEIPTTPDADRVILITLGDNTVQIRTYYNSISQYYYMDILTEQEEPIELGITLKGFFNLMLTKSLTARYGQIRMTAPAFGFGSLGTTAKMMWFEAGEFEALAIDEIGDTATLPITYDFDALFPPRLQL